MAGTKSGSQSHGLKFGGIATNPSTDIGKKFGGVSTISSIGTGQNFDRGAAAFYRKFSEEFEIVH